MLAWLLWGLTVSGLAGGFWLDHLLRQGGRPDLALLTPGTAYPVLVAVAGIATVGAVLAGRRPRHPVGWLLLALALSVAADGVTDGYARYGLLASPGAVPAVGHVRALGNTFALWPACIGFILLLTPTGTLPSARWRWWAWIAVAAPLSWQAAAVLGFEMVEFPPFYSIRNPFFVPPWPPRPGSSPSRRLWSRCSAWSWAAPRWWSASAGPGARSASSCAG
jgi:hypothetical protein